MSNHEQNSSVESTNPQTTNTPEICQEKTDLQVKLDKVAAEHGGKVLSVQTIQKKPNYSLPERPIEPLKPVGKERTTGKEYEEAIKSNHARKAWDSIQAMKDEANTDNIMPDEKIKAILEEAHENPVTKNLIEEARQLTIENSESIQKQVNDLVAMYNVKQDKAFFFITSAEARLAIDYVKRCREGHVEELRDLQLQDEMVYRLMKQLPSMGLVTAANGFINDKEERSIYQIRKDLMDLCWMDTPEAKIMSRRGGFAPLSTDNELFFSTLYGDQDLAKRIEVLERAKAKGVVDPIALEKDKEEVKVVPEFLVYNYAMDVGYQDIGGKKQEMTLSSINQLFATIEQYDLTVDVLLMNARNIATIRNFGKTVYDEYSKREFIKRKVFGKLFSAEIYVCNYLKDNQVLAGSVGIKPHGIFLNAIFQSKHTTPNTLK